MGEVFEIEIDTLETTCHALDPTPVANCSVRQLQEHVSGTLRVTLDGGPASSTVILQRAGPFYPAAQTALRTRECVILKLPFETTFPRADFYNSSTFLL